MRESNRPAVARGGALAAALAVLSIPGAAHAQYIHNDAPPLPAAPVAGSYESPTDKLARNVRILAQQPKNFPALIAAGRASLAMGDIPSAEGFFGRADEINPNDPAPKVGMAGAAVLSGNLDEAQNWLGRAQRLGATQAMVGTDRGLLLDLKGDLGSAQADYRAALAGPDPDEARRRYALSLGMGGRMDDGLKILEPLLRQRDPAAMRVRAFVLALGGQKAAAVQAIEQAMPGSGGRIAPFFDSLPVLGVAQKAAAVHLGIFPSEAEVRLARAQSQSQAAAPPVAAAPVRTASAKPPKASRTRKRSGDGFRVAVTTTPIEQPVQAPASVSRTPIQVAESTPIQQPPPAPAFSLPSSAPAASPPVATPTPAPATVAMAGDRLSGIDKLLADNRTEPLAPPPPPPRPKVETPKAASSSATSKASEAKKAAAAKAKADAEEKRKADAEAKALGVSGTTWVQLAGGSNADRMASEYKRIKAKKADLFAKRSGYVTQGKDYFRLLVGPFKDAADARDFVNSLAKAGIDSFMWTRSPPTIRIEKLPSK